MILHWFKLALVDLMWQSLCVSHAWLQYVCFRELGLAHTVHTTWSCIMTLQSCLDLKNYEAVFALMEGLESKSVQQAEGSWQVNSDNYFYSTITYCPYSYSVHILCQCHWMVQMYLIFQMVTDHLLGMYEELKEIVSSEINYHRYRQDIRVVHQSPCIPHLS